MMLRIEDVNVGDRLECVDIDRFERSYDAIRSNNSFEVLKILSNGTIVTIGGFHISHSSIKYFKKKEQSQYTLDDLVNVAFQAKKDGVICEVIWNDFLSVSGISLENQIVVASDQVSSDFICDAVNAIKSLYKETFVIECEEDIKKIKLKSEVTLLNNNKFIVDNVSDKFITPNNSFDKLTILSLKGAKVEQSK